MIALNTFKYGVNRNRVFYRVGYNYITIALATINSKYRKMTDWEGKKAYITIPITHLESFFKINY